MSETTAGPAEVDQPTTRVPEEGGEIQPSQPPDSVSGKPRSISPRFKKIVRVGVFLVGLSTVVSGILTYVLYSNPKGLTDAGEYALVQPMVETLLSTAVEVSSAVLVTVFALILLVVTIGQVAQQRVPIALTSRGQLAALFMPAAAAIFSLAASVVGRVWVGYASFDWVPPYLGVAIPIRFSMIFLILAELSLLALGLLITWRAVTEG